MSLVPRAGRPAAESPPAAWISTGDADELRARARAWVSSPALERVLEAFAGPRLRAEVDVPLLREWSGMRLDTRAGRERHEADAAAFTEAQVEALLAAAGPLGLVETAMPTRPSYGLTVVLGGTVTGNVLRAALAFDLVRKGLDPGVLAGVSGHRALSSAEREVALAEGTPAEATENEVEHLAWAFGRQVGEARRRTLRSGGRTGAFDAWRVEALEGAPLPAYVLQAPSRRVERRPDTLDALTFARRELGGETGPTLLVTSAIYAPYTFFLLGRHATPASPVEVIGTPTAPSPVPARQAQRIAQEIHATLQALPL